MSVLSCSVHVAGVRDAVPLGLRIIRCGVADFAPRLSFDKVLYGMQDSPDIMEKGRKRGDYVLPMTPGRTPTLTQQDEPRWMGALRVWPYLMHVVLLVALYVGTAKPGLSLPAVGVFATAVWPPTGLALVALVFGGYRLWPGIALGAYLVNVWAGAPLLVTAGMALGNTFEALLGAASLRRVVRFCPALERLREVAGLVGAAILSTLVSAMVGVTSGWLGGGHCTNVYEAQVLRYGESWHQQSLGLIEFRTQPIIPLPPVSACRCVRRASSRYGLWT